MTSAAPSPGIPTRLSRGALVLLAFLSVLPYLNGLTGEFTYDDKLIIRDNARLSSPSRLGEIFTTHYFGGPMASGTAYRPLVLVTYAVQRWTTGNRTFFFHLVNVALHAGTTLLLASWLLGLGFRAAPVLAVSSLFAVLTIHVEAVTGLVGRAEVLAALLVFASARWFLDATAGERLVRRFYLGSLAAFLAAVFVKENAIVVPALIGLGELVRGEPEPIATRVRRLLRERGAALAGYLVPVVVLFGVRRLVLNGFLMSKDAGVFDLENPLVVVSPAVRIGNAAILLWRYVWKTFVPVGLSADHSAYALPLDTRITQVRSLLALTALAAAALATLLFARRRSLAAFGAALFIGTFLPTANFVFPIGTIYAERLMYLPSAGLLCVAVGLAVGGPRAVPRPAAWPWRETAVVALVLLSIGATWSRNRVFENDSALYADMIVKVPSSAKAHYNYAYDAIRRKVKDVPKAHVRQAVEIFPRYYDAWALLGKLEWDDERLPEAVAAYRRAVEIFPHYENGRWGLAKTLETSGARAEAEQAFRAGIKEFPQSYPLAYHFASFLEEGDCYEEAEIEWARAVKAGSGAARARLAHARVLSHLERENDSWNEARWALVNDSDNLDARQFLARRYEAAGKILGAAGELQRAVRSHPQDAQVGAQYLELLDRHPELRSRRSLTVPTIVARFGARPTDLRLRAALGIFAD
ncbi:MAG: tetratricopeptide repeat protein [Thermoanaerobaculia bacterium]